MVAPSVFLTPNMMQAVLIYAFAAAILGGLESPVGAVVGGLALGVGLNLLGTYVSCGERPSSASPSRWWCCSSCCSCAPPACSAVRS